MPKGALLHVHLELTVDAHSLLRLALPHRSIHIRSPEVITSVNLSSVVPEIKPLDPDFKAEVFSLTDPTYIPASWAPLHCARELFNKDLGGSRGFDKWVTNHMVINASTAYVTHNNNKRVWYTVCFALLDDERNSHRVDQIWNKFRSSAHLYMVYFSLNITFCCTLKMVSESRLLYTHMGTIYPTVFRRYHCRWRNVC